jgi:hypothetical protein
LRSEIREILNQADRRSPSLDEVQRTLAEVAKWLNVPIDLRMHEPEKTWPVRLLLTEHRRPGSPTTYICHTQVGADRFDTPFAQVSTLLCYILQIAI